MARKATNIVAFAPRAASIRARLKSEALAQRAKELRFKSVGSKPRRHPLAALTIDDMIHEIEAWNQLADKVCATAKTWKRLFEVSRRELHAANRKIARLEKKLAVARLRTA